MEALTYKRVGNWLETSFPLEPKESLEETKKADERFMKALMTYIQEQHKGAKPL